MIEKFVVGTGLNLDFDIETKLNEIIATVNEQEKKIDFIMENIVLPDDWKIGDLEKTTIKELYEKR